MISMIMIPKQSVRAQDALRDSDQLTDVYLWEHCEDNSSRFSTGACFNLDQFSQVTLGSADYTHLPKDGKQLENCTAKFDELPAELNVLLIQEDGIAQFLTGADKLNQACFLRISLGPITQPDWLD